MKEKMLSGELYVCADEAVMAEQARCLEILYDYNQTRPSEQQKRAEILQKLLARAGKDLYIEPPLHANWGCHTYFGDSVYANFNLTLVDDGEIHIGDHTMLGPNVVLATAGHPILPQLREQVMQFNLPIHIGRNCWLGAGVIVLPGVTIGENTVVGAGSVVTKDLPANVVAVGNPCRVLRPIGEQDRVFYAKGRKIPEELR